MPAVSAATSQVLSTESPVEHGQRTASCDTSHTRTEVRDCCKGDEASQWRNPKFDPPPRPNPVSDRNTNRHT